MAKSKVNELLAQLDDAFEVAEAKAATSAQVAADAARAVAEAQVHLDAVKAEQSAYVQAAQQDAAKAREALEQVREQVNARVGALTGQGTDPRVNVR